jgi:hypothetical protein
MRLWKGGGCHQPKPPPRRSPLGPGLFCWRFTTAARHLPHTSALACFICQLNPNQKHLNPIPEVFFSTPRPLFVVGARSAPPSAGFLLAVVPSTVEHLKRHGFRKKRGLASGRCSRPDARIYKSAHQKIARAALRVGVACSARWPVVLARKLWAQTQTPTHPEPKQTTATNRT